MVAYVENWKACPTDAQLAQYTHVIYAFTVTYTWTPAENLCDSQCVLRTPDACGGESIQQFLARAHSHGVKVLLSLGGAGMGGLWDLSKNRCWDPCWDKPVDLAQQTVDQVLTYGFDGVDVDYEYLLETDQQRQFLVDLTLTLRQLLPEGAELSHAPMDYTLNKGTAYYELLRQMGPALDFLMPQYYNGHLNVVTSDTDLTASMTHFGDLVEAMGGDASRVVYGFCLHDCGAWNAAKERAGEVAATLGDSFPNHGGVFYWAASGDSNGAWPAYVHQEQGSHASTDSSSSSPGGASQPTAQPTAQPTPGTSTSSSACLGEWASCTDSSSCCQEGLQCFRQHQWYSQCLKSCPAGWECQSGL